MNLSEGLPLLGDVENKDDAMGSFVDVQTLCVKTGLLHLSQSSMVKLQNWDLNLKVKINGSDPLLQLSVGPVREISLKPRG